MCLKINFSIATNCEHCDDGRDVEHEWFDIKSLSDWEEKKNNWTNWWTGLFASSRRERERITKNWKFAKTKPGDKLRLQLEYPVRWFYFNSVNVYILYNFSSLCPDTDQQTLPYIKLIFFFLFYVCFWWCVYVFLCSFRLLTSVDFFSLSLFSHFSMIIVVVIQFNVNGRYVCIACRQSIKLPLFFPFFLLLISFLRMVVAYFILCKIWILTVKRHIVQYSSNERKKKIRKAESLAFSIFCSFTLWSSFILFSSIHFMIHMFIHMTGRKLNAHYNWMGQQTFWL